MPYEQINRASQELLLDYLDGLAATQPCLLCGYALNRAESIAYRLAKGMRVR
jgi:phage terminase small subunit